MSLCSVARTDDFGHMLGKNSNVYQISIHLIMQLVDCGALI